MFATRSVMGAQPKIETDFQKRTDQDSSIGIDVRQKMAFPDIAKLNLRDCKPDPVIPFSTQGDPVKFVERQRAILLNVADRIRRTTAFQILERNGDTAARGPFVIDKSTWLDLDLVTGSDEHPTSYLGSVIDRTQTEIGKAYLLGLIASPTADVAILRKRQALVKAFVDLSDELSCHLKGMDGGEAQLLSFWDGKMQLPGSVLNQFFKYHKLIDSVCNKNALALELNSTLENAKKIAATTTQAASSILLPLYAASLALMDDTPEVLEGYSTRFIGQSGPLYSVASLVPNRFTQATTALLAGGFAFISLQSKIKWTQADLSVDTIIQNKLVAVASFYREMREIYTILSANPEIAGNLEHFNKLEAFMNNKDLSGLFYVLESRTFDSEAGYLFRRGNVLLAWSHLEDPKVKKQFELALTAIAEIDALMSVAALVRETKSDRVSYCFPEYVENSTLPYLELNNFWNPIVDQNVVVTNSIKMGGKTQPANVIFTAPNASGKSTTIKGATDAVILALSLTIAPADSMKLTPFSLVASSMNITDDIKSGKSLFQAQVDVIVDLGKKLDALPKGAFSFAVLDELFTGTTPDEGAALAYAAVESLGKRSNIINMIVTHHAFLTELASAPNSRFRNYKLSVNEKTHKPLYVIEPGISKQHIALDVAGSRGISEETLARARELMAKNAKDA